MTGAVRARKPRTVTGTDRHHAMSTNSRCSARQPPCTPAPHNCSSTSPRPRSSTRTPTSSASDSRRNTRSDAREGRHRRRRSGRRDRCLLLRHDDGRTRSRRRNTLRRRPYTAATICPAFELIKSPARHLQDLQRVLHVPARAGARLWRLRREPGPERRQAGRHRDLLGADGLPLQRRAARGEAVLLNRGLGARRGGREGPRGDGDRPHATARSLGRGTDPIRRRDRSAVARNKLPDSDLAGRATVFVFPDLNTCEPVQRSGGAVGPVL